MKGAVLRGRAAACCLAGLVLSACGGSGKTAGPDAPEVSPETSGDDSPVLFEARGDQADGGPADGVDASNPEVIADAGELGQDVYLPKPCQTHLDCEDGFCVEFPPGAGTFYCAPTCIEECPGDLVCKSIYIDGPDPVSVCLPAQDVVCAVCKDSLDCLYAGTLCIKGPSGYGYCAVVCEPGGACPDGTECGQVEIPGGGMGDFCLPAASQCCVKGKLAGCDDGNPCTEEGCNPALGCTHQPVDGECSGDDPCKIYACQEGECVGTPVVADLVLDGVDEDCDGLTDEDAYKGFRLTGSTVVAAGEGPASEGAGLVLRAVAGGCDWSGTATEGGFNLEPGVTPVLGSVK